MRHADTSHDVVIKANAAGDFRLRLQRSKHAGVYVKTESDAALVCSPKVQVMTTGDVERMRVGYGGLSTRTAFGRDARQLMREVGQVLEQGELSQCLFLTGTLPGSTEIAKETLARWSAWIVRNVAQWVRDTVGTVQYFGVWEYQRRGALHLHLCVRVSSNSHANTVLSRWHQVWCRILSALSTKCSVDLFQRKDGSTWKDNQTVVRTDAQRVEKSVGRYLSKYLSKGCTARMSAATYPPSRWWFCSKELRQIAVSLRQELRVERLSLCTALDLFEKIAGEIVGQKRPAFSCTSPVDARFKGITALLAPIECGLVFKQMAAVLGILQPSPERSERRERASVVQTCIYFAGQLVAVQSPHVNSC